MAVGGDNCWRVPIAQGGGVPISLSGGGVPELLGIPTVSGGVPLLKRGPRVAGGATA